MAKFEVFVGNIGLVFEGEHENNARRLFNSWAELSKHEHGRAAGENVTLFKDGDIIKEYEGHGKE